jgi:hypothetical protein
MDIRTDYVSKPFFSLDIELDNGNILTLNWNIFEDKKDDNKLVLRVRYVLTDNDGERTSLKKLNFTLPVKFEQIYVDEKIEAEIESLSTDEIEDFISDKFGFWLMTDFLEMINSGEISTFK